MALSRLGAFVQHRCDDLRAREADFHYRWVEKRKKKPTSVIRALNEKGSGPERVWADVNDLLGVRVVVVTKSMARRLADDLAVAVSSPIVGAEILDQDHPCTGYRAIHVKGRYDGKEAFGCEVQIRTALEDAWGVVSRLELYKGSVVPDVLLHTARIEAAHLHASDDAFDMILGEMRKAQPPTGAPTSSEPLDTASPDPQAAALEQAAEAKIDSSEDPIEQRDNEHILRSPISQRRVSEFLERFLVDRTRVATTQMVFEGVGRFQQLAPRSDVRVTGYNVLVDKGPFVEGSTWIPMETWGLATGLERDLLNRLERELAATSVLATVRETLPRIRIDVDQIIAGARSMMAELRQAQQTPSLVVLTGELTTNLAVAIEDRITSHTDLIGIGSSTYRLLGTLDGIPIIENYPSAKPTLYVVDLARFASLTKYGDVVSFAVDPIDEIKARQMLAKNRNFGNNFSTNEVDIDRWVRYLQLHVNLRLSEAYQLEIHDPSAVLAASLVS